MPAPTAPWIDTATPTELADSVVAAYGRVTDDILINIARHFNDGKSLPTFEWQVQKLAELGKLTQENIAIIQKAYGEMSELVTLAIEQSAFAALDELEPAFRKAVVEGYLMDTKTAMSVTARRTAEAFQMQALQKYNLVNTSMLRSSLDAYRKAVADTAVYEAQLVEAQKLLNSGAAGMLSGAESRTQALRRAVHEMADKGLTGFTDRAGRKWSPEAYVNMDLRTTMGNTATRAAFNRNDDYGNDLIHVPILRAARPGCYPYQGKVYSTNNRSGVVLDLDDMPIRFSPLSSTTYGEPAGLFGINCHHTPPGIFIPGMTKLHGEVPPKDENDAEYAVLQEQRRLEREVRYAKRDALMADASGDEEAFDEAALKIKQSRERLKAYSEEHGLYFASDRTYKEGYNRSVSARAKASVKRQESSLADRQAAWDRKFNDEYLARNESELLSGRDDPQGITAKLTTYSLRSDHPVGKHKAKVFESALGYNASNEAELEAEIIRGLSQYKTIPRGNNGYGEMANVIMLIHGNNGNVQPVTTSWIYDTPEAKPRMVTAYVHDKLRRP